MSTSNTTYVENYRGWKIRRNILGAYSGVSKHGTTPMYVNKNRVLAWIDNLYTQGFIIDYEQLEKNMLDIVWTNI